MKRQLKPESTFGELPVGARFIVPWTGETFVKTTASNCGMLVARNTITEPDNFADGVRVRQVGDATTMPDELGVPIFPPSQSSSNSNDDDVVDGPRRFHFVLDDSECEAAAQQDAPTYYQQRPEQAKAKLGKAVRREL